MRLRDLFAVAIAGCLVASACSRLSFVKPSAKRGDSEQVAREYDFSEGRKGRSDGTVYVHLGRAQQHLAAGRNEEAAEEARAALEIDDGSDVAHMVFAVASERLGRDGEAGRHFARAAEISPGSGAMLNNYGAWLCRNGREAESLAWFDRALADRTYATPASALANAGACAERGGQPGRVERDLRAALQLDPDNAVALGELAEYQYRQGAYFEARAFSQRRLDAAPVTPAALLLASQIEEKLGDKAAAARYVQRLRTEFPQSQADLPGESSSP